MADTALVWFNKDLRLEDNEAFINACNHHEKIIPLYIYEKENRLLGGAQKWWLHHSLNSLDNSLKKLGLKLILLQGNPSKILPELIKDYKIKALYWNLSFEPKVRAREEKLQSLFLKEDVEVNLYNAYLLNEPENIKNQSGTYFKVFTPYWKHCLNQMNKPVGSTLVNKPQALKVASEELDDWNLLPHLSWADQFQDHWQPGEAGAQIKLQEFVQDHLTAYGVNRDFPGKDATSKLSPHLHFGEISPWTVLEAIEIAKLDKNCDLASAERFITELGWREFCYHLLWHVPNLDSENFRQEFNDFAWQKDDEALSSWQQGQTGYPIVDAGMRELWTTGYMQNRVRMIVASFLTKDLLIDWRLGAAWFLDTLLDADLASNSANWQWVAGCGADAAPYFRIFNPVLQGEKFDPQGHYVRRWVPELAKVSNKFIHKPWQASPQELGIKLGTDYPYPLVDHAEARISALELYKKLKK